MTRTLGITYKSRTIYLFQQSKRGSENVFNVLASTAAGGIKISPFEINNNGKRENLLKCFDFRITKVNSDFLLFYRSESKEPGIYVAKSKDLQKWLVVSKLPAPMGTAMLIPKKKMALVGGLAIKLATSKNEMDWQIVEKPVLEPRPNYFDYGPLEVGGIFYEKNGILIFYYSKVRRGEGVHYNVGAALLDHKNPAKVIWRLDHPLWEYPDEWNKRGIYPIGIIETKHKTMYWGDSAGEIYSVSSSDWDHLSDETPSSIKLQKHPENPVISPNPAIPWQSKATFNPAALYLDGKVHLVYRAIGDSDVSVMGYAASKDGLNFDERSDIPAYVPREEFEGAAKPHIGNPSTTFMSGGGGWGGCEDPRLTKIDETIYMTYVAYNGWNEPRIALTSISVDDFTKQSWNWSKPVLISRPGEVNKNACILPEKINGKYVIFHRVYPDILVDFVDNLDFDGETKWLKNQNKIKPRRNYWDSRKVGAGPPPIKTDKGWLMIYQGLGEQESNKYKIGAMLLDLNDPTKVIARTQKPILEPEEKYENEGWKFGVVYPCGAVAIDNQLLVYYGGADMYVGAAIADLNEFVEKLINKQDPMIHQISSIVISKIDDHHA